MQIKVVRFKVMGALQDTPDLNPAHKTQQENSAERVNCDALTVPILGASIRGTSKCSSGGSDQIGFGTRNGIEKAL